MTSSDPSAQVSLQLRTVTNSSESFKKKIEQT